VGSQHYDIYGLTLGSELAIGLSHEDTNGANKASISNRLLGGIMGIRGGDRRTKHARTAMSMNILSYGFFRREEGRTLIDKDYLWHSDRLVTPPGAGFPLFRHDYRMQKTVFLLYRTCCNKIVPRRVKVKSKQ
jgi:hypothetical protein